MGPVDGLDFGGGLRLELLRELDGDGSWRRLGGELDGDFSGRVRGKVIIFESVGDGCGGRKGGEFAR